MNDNVLLEEIKSKLTFKELFDYYGITYRTGGNYVLGKCPFCNYKNKEYDLVSYDSGKTWCFNCSWKGDIFKFIQEKENTDFIGSLKKACEILGIEYQPKGYSKEAVEQWKKKQEEKKAAEELFEKKIDEYHKNLVDNHKDLVAYCLERGLTKETLEKFKIGYCENEKPTKELVNCGLCGKNKEGKIFFPFKNRLVIPYLDSKNKPVFAIFRQTKYTYVPKNEDGTPKDVRFKKLYSGNNSLLDNTLFYSNHKKTKTLIIAEGIFDSLCVAQNDFSTASFITILPSAANIKEIIPLLSVYEEAVIIFDSEENKSGEKGVIKTIEILYSAGLTNIKTYIIPKPEEVEKIDLNDVLKSLSIEKQKETLQEMIKKSLYAVDYLCDSLNFENATEKAQSLNRLADLFKQFYFKDKTFFEAVKEDIGKKLDLTKKTINEAFNVSVKKEIEEKQKASGKNEDFDIKKVAELTLNNIFYEIVANQERAFFISLNESGEPVYQEYVFDPKIEAMIFPIFNEVVKKKAIILPEQVIPYESEEKLLEEIQAFIHAYLDVSPDYELFASYYVLLSWIYDSISTIPYLRALGDFACGKSRMLETIGKICYRPLVMSGAVSPAAFFRLQGVWKGTALLDEADRNKSDETDILITTLNCGFERGKPVLRAGTNDPNDIEAFDPFGPKIITTRYPFKDQALESRCLTERMRSTDRDDIPTILPLKFYREQEELRQKLLMFRLKERNKIDADKIQDINLGNIERRLKQALSSFAVLFVHKKVLFDKFKKFVLEYQMQLIGERETSFDGLIVNYLFDQRESEDKDELSSGDIAKYLESEHNIKKNSSYVGHRLKGLGLETKPQKVDKRMKRVINWDLKTMEKLFQKYNASYWIEKNGSKAVSLVSVVSEVAVSGRGKNTKKNLEIITTKMSDFEDKSKNNEDSGQNEANCEDCEKSFKESELKKVKMEDGTIFKVCSSCLPESIAAGGIVLE